MRHTVLPFLCVLSVNAVAAELSSEAAVVSPAVELSTELKTSANASDNKIFNSRSVLNQLLAEAESGKVNNSGNQVTIDLTPNTSLYMQRSDSSEHLTQTQQDIAKLNKSGFHLNVPKLSHDPVFDMKFTVIPDDGFFISDLPHIAANGGHLGAQSQCCNKQNSFMQHARRNTEMAHFRDKFGNEKGTVLYLYATEAAPYNGIHPMTKDEVTKFLQKP